MAWAATSNTPSDLRPTWDLLDSGDRGHGQNAVHPAKGPSEPRDPSPAPPPAGSPQSPPVWPDPAMASTVMSCRAGRELLQEGSHKHLPGLWELQGPSDQAGLEP